MVNPSSPPPTFHQSRCAQTNQDELDEVIGDWAAVRQPADIIATLSEAGVVSGPINAVAEVVEDPQLRARGMIADHWDERIGRTVKGPGVVPVLSERRGPSAAPGRPPGQHNDQCTHACSARGGAEQDHASGGGRRLTALPSGPM